MSEPELGTAPQNVETTIEGANEGSLGPPPAKRQKLDNYNSVPIKPQYLVNRSKIVPDEVPVAPTEAPKPTVSTPVPGSMQVEPTSEGCGDGSCDPVEGAAVASTPSDNAKKENKKKRKGTHKQNRKENIKLEPKNTLPRLCVSVVKGRECTHPNCKGVHDVEAWRATQPPLLTTLPCPHWTKKGTCPFGIACRFLTSHVPSAVPTPAPVGSAAAATAPDAPTTPAATKPANATFKLETTNALSQELKIALNKRKIKYPISESVVKQLKVKTNAPEGEKMPMRERRKNVDFKGKLILAPLTTIGNLPYRRICKRYGADITIGEMALASNLLQGKPAEWALVQRHESEDVFGVQLAVNFADRASQAVELLTKHTDVDFIDLNCGCPIDLMFQQGLGSGLMMRQSKMAEVVKAMAHTADIPVTVKVRIGKDWNRPIAHSFVAPNVALWGAAALTVHGRSKDQRYSKLADWDYIDKCARACPDIPVIGNGDIYDWTDAVEHYEKSSVSSLMLARGAIIKPWLFTEIKERRNWDISSSERFDILKDFVNFGLEHWGSDYTGVERTRYFLLNWMSFLCRYVPVGLVERLPVKINQYPPPFIGRDDMETWMGSNKIDDWVRISSMLLGPPPSNFAFEPKHKSNSYEASRDGSAAESSNNDEAEG